RDRHNQVIGIKQPLLIMHQFRSLDHESGEPRLDQSQVQWMQSMKRSSHAGENHIFEMPFLKTFFQLCQPVRLFEERERAIELLWLIEVVSQVIAFYR